MLIGITGAQRSGKTLTMTALSLYLSESMGVPLYSSYGIKYSKELTSIDQLQNLDNAIVAIDDFYQDLDSRNFKNNIVLTQFINNVAKKQLIVFFVTHTMGQIDLRVRNATDIVIFCEKILDDIWLHFIDYRFKRYIRKFLYSNPKVIYPFYDTYLRPKPLNI